MRSTEPARRRASRGFAYLWLLLAVALIGLGLSAGAEVFKTAVRRDKEKELLFQGRQFRAALMSYSSDAAAAQTQRFPMSLEELLENTKVDRKVRRHLRQIYVDPMTGRPEWGLIRREGRIVGVHSLSQSEPLKQQGFEGLETRFNGARHYSDWVFSAEP